ncbi:MAG TPA: VOC family protein [Pseudonocardia sp.]
MRLENIVWDARDPRRLGRFWAAAVGGEAITDEPDIVEVRLRLRDQFFLDLCFPRVASPSTSPVRLHPALAGGTPYEESVQRLLDLGAEHIPGRGDDCGISLADPEGNPFYVPEDREIYRNAGPVAAVRLDSADPDRDVVFWATITGWVPDAGPSGVATLRHPCGTGPLLELCPEREPKRGKNRLHLDVRREAGDGDIVERLPERGATALTRPGDLPWLVFADPSGNEFCVLDEAPRGR